MREDLLGYLLDALEPSEQEQVERELQRSPQLRDELQRLRAQLAPFIAWSALIALAATMPVMWAGWRIYWSATTRIRTTSFRALSGDSGCNGSWTVYQIK